MSKWTRANPLMSVPGYGVPPGHFANGYTNGGDRVGFKKVEEQEQEIENRKNLEKEEKHRKRDIKE